MDKTGISAIAEMAGRKAASDFLRLYTQTFGSPQLDWKRFEEALADFMALAIQDTMNARKMVSDGITRLLS